MHDAGQNSTIQDLIKEVSFRNGLAAHSLCVLTKESSMMENSKRCAEQFKKGFRFVKTTIIIVTFFECL
jgi:hypothetical protein